MRAVLSADFHDGAGQFVVVAQDPPFRRQGVAQLRGTVVVDRPAGEGRQETGRIDDRGESQVRQGEDHPSLADAAGIEVPGLHGQRRTAIARPDLFQPRSDAAGEAVPFRKKLLDIHGINRSGRRWRGPPAA